MNRLWLKLTSPFRTHVEVIERPDGRVVTIVRNWWGCSISTSGKGSSASVRVADGRIVATASSDGQ